MNFRCHSIGQTRSCPVHAGLRLRPNSALIMETKQCANDDMARSSTWWPSLSIPQPKKPYNRKGDHRLMHIFTSKHWKKVLLGKVRFFHLCSWLHFSPMDSLAWQHTCCFTFITCIAFIASSWFQWTSARWVGCHHILLSLSFVIVIVRRKIKKDRQSQEDEKWHLHLVPGGVILSGRIGRNDLHLSCHPSLEDEWSRA